MLRLDMFQTVRGCEMVMVGKLACFVAAAAVAAGYQKDNEVWEGTRLDNNSTSELFHTKAETKTTWTHFHCKGKNMARSKAIRTPMRVGSNSLDGRCISFKALR